MRRPAPLDAMAEVVRIGSWAAPGKREEKDWARQAAIEELARPRP